MVPSLHVLAYRAASKAYGRHNACVCKERLGGECLWTGCVPSKSLIASANAAHQTRHLNTLGLESTIVPVDLGTVMDRVQIESTRGSWCPGPSAVLLRALAWTLPRCFLRIPVGANALIYGAGTIGLLMLQVVARFRGDSARASASRRARCRRGAAVRHRARRPRQLAWGLVCAI
jgi:hypothetical protein